MSNMVIGALKKCQTRRSSDECWPLRNADGKTWAEAKQESANGKYGRNSSPRN